MRQTQILRSSKRRRPEDPAIDALPPTTPADTAAAAALIHSINALLDR